MGPFAHQKKTIDCGFRFNLNKIRAKAAFINIQQEEFR